MGFSPDRQSRPSRPSLLRLPSAARGNVWGAKGALLHRTANQKESGKTSCAVCGPFCSMYSSVDARQKCKGKREPHILDLSRAREVARHRARAQTDKQRDRQTDRLFDEFPVTWNTVKIRDRRASGVPSRAGTVGAIKQGTLWVLGTP